MRPSPTFQEIVKKKASKCNCSAECIKKFIFSFFPCINIMKNYKIREDLSGDIISGLTVGIMHIPQGKLFVVNILTLHPCSPRWCVMFSLPKNNLHLCCKCRSSQFHLLCNEWGSTGYKNPGTENNWPQLHNRWKHLKIRMSPAYRNGMIKVRKRL